MSNLSASPHGRSILNFQFITWSYCLLVWKPCHRGSLIGILSLCPLHFVVIFLFFFSFSPPPWCTFVLKNKTSLSGYSATSALSSDCRLRSVEWKGQILAISSSAHFLINVLWTWVSVPGGGTKIARGKGSCSHQNFKTPRDGVTADV